MIKLIDGEESAYPAEHLDEQMALNEMATLLYKDEGRGMEIIINSNDHPPAHMHVKDLNRKDVARVIIPPSEPKSIDGIRTIEEDSLTNKWKKKILEFLNYYDENEGMTKWRIAKVLWNSFHRNHKI